MQTMPCCSSHLVTITLWGKAADATAVSEQPYVPPNTSFLPGSWWVMPNTWLKTVEIPLEYIDRNWYCIETDFFPLSFKMKIEKTITVAVLKYLQNIVFAKIMASCTYFISHPKWLVSSVRLLELTGIWSLQGSGCWVFMWFACPIGASVRVIRVQVWMDVDLPRKTG